MERNKTEQLQLLRSAHLLHMGYEAAFDRLTRLATTILNVPVSLIFLVDRDYQYMKSQTGLPEPRASQRHMPLSASFHEWMGASHELLVVSDAQDDARLRDNAALLELDIVAYLRVPLLIEDQVIGSFWAVDSHPHMWTPREIEIVRELALIATAEIELRLESTRSQKIAPPLRESDIRFRALANHAPIIIWQMDKERGAFFFNATWSTFTGLSEQESLGMGWTQAIYPEDREEIITSWQQALQANVPFHHEFRLIRADGVVCEVISHSSIYTDEYGTPGRAVGTMLDVSVQKESERQREAAMSMATHELKTPLTSAQGFLQLAQRSLRHLAEQFSTLTAEQQQLFAQIRKMQEQSLESLKMEVRLLDDLLDLSRVQARKIEYHLAPCDLFQIVQETVNQQQETAFPRLLILMPPRQAAFPVLADAQRLRQVLTNYITNAFKYSPPERPVEVGISLQGSSARVWVRDQGIGLTPEQLTHIWERFYQTNEASFHVGTPGLGLGLSICQMLIRGQGGEVGVESRRGEGSTFWFTLPMMGQETKGVLLNEG